MGSFGADLLRGLAQASNNLPGAMKNRFAQQQQVKASQQAQTDKVWNRFMSTATVDPTLSLPFEQQLIKKGLLPPVVEGEDSHSSRLYGQEMNKTGWTEAKNGLFFHRTMPNGDFETKEMPFRQEEWKPAGGGKFFYYNDPMKGLQIDENPKYVSTVEERATMWKEDFDAGLSYRNNPETGQIEVTPLEGSQGVRTKEKGDLYTEFYEQLDVLSAEKAMAGLEAKAKVIGLDISDVAGTIQTTFEMRDMEVDFTADVKNKMILDRQTQMLATQALTLLSGLTEEQKAKMGVSGGRYTKFKKWVGGGAQEGNLVGVDPEIEDLSLLLRQTMEVFARRQTGAAISEGEEARFDELTGADIALDPEAISLRLEELINFGNRMRVAAYTTALEDKHDGVIPASVEAKIPTLLYDMTKVAPHISAKRLRAIAGGGVKWAENELKRRGL